jgi:murein DD-endopeptidase MepM/ murein hydrolase activator NlpD
MKKQYISLVISLFLPVALFAQAPDTTINKRALFPGGGTSAPDTLTIPKDFVTEPGSFQQGKGAEVDTLDIQDGRLLLVLKDDHTWYYIKNFKMMESDSTFVKDWVPNTTNPYTAPLESLPLRNSIALVDSASRFVVPYQTKVFSRFGMRRGRRHQGVDLPLKTGTPVVAAFDGRVRASTYSKGYGNLVIIRHENGLETFYGHLSKREVEVGDWVRAGDEIGLGGSTGRSTGPHLHFETRYQGYAFDPEWIADYEKGELRKNVFVLRRSYLDAHSRYTPESIDEEDEIYADEERIVEEEKRIAAERAAMRYHTVKNGESLSVIARKEGKSLNAIIKLNPGINPDKLSIGQKIRVN